MSDKAVRAMLALTVLALSVFYVVTKPPRLGLDLRGGTQIVLETRSTDHRQGRTPSRPTGP